MKCRFFEFVLICLVFDGVFSNFIGTLCPRVQLKNGRIRSRQRGRVLKFLCHNGYLLVGERYNICTAGKWELPPPKCVRPTCPNKVQPPTNGLIFPSYGGAVLDFYCKAGFQLRGPPALNCDGAKWDNNPPTCFPVNTKPALFCDFEDEDICKWTHDLNHDFDWKRECYQTPSGAIGTGPSHDHTKGAGRNGHYMYIESSSRRENDTARLISPVFESMPNNSCLEFFYHMYGATTGTLRAYVKKVSEPWPLDPVNAIFSKSGNQGDRWFRSLVNLGAVDDEFQVIMEGVRGPGYVSDIAIDDIGIIQNCVYEDHIFTTTEQSMTENEVLKPVESCENRCGHQATSSEANLTITCDCDDACFENNRCCPDYFDSCFISSSTYDYTTATNLPSTSVEVEAPDNATENETKAPQQRLPPTTRKPTNNANAATPRRRPFIQTQTTRRRLIILTQPTTPRIIRKVLPTQSNVDTNYIMDPPPPTEDAIATPPEDADYYVEEIAREMEAPYLRPLATGNRAFSQSREEPSNVKTALVVVAACCGVAVVAVLTAVALVRYRRVRRIVGLGQGDSQSDVRFLTSDEALDFSLDRGYDSL